MSVDPGDTRRRWYLIEFHDGKVNYQARHHVETLAATRTACGYPLLPPRAGLYVQRYPKKQPPKCRACIRAVARRTIP